jgi:hypothetical protein
MVEVIAFEVHASTLFRTGHMVNRWFREIADQLEHATEAAAPFRSGDLKAGIGTSVSAQAEALTNTMTWRSEAPHTMAVLRGTLIPTKAMPNNRGTIGPKGHEQWITSRTPGKKMRVRGAGPPRQLHVSGQKQNNFLLTGWRVVSLRHRAMRSIPTFVRFP